MALSKDPFIKNSMLLANGGVILVDVVKLDFLLMLLENALAQSVV